MIISYYFSEFSECSETRKWKHKTKTVADKIKYTENTNTLVKKKGTLSQARWRMPVVPAAWETEARA